MPLGAEAIAETSRSEIELEGLVQRARSGDKAAMEEIIRTMQGRIRAFTRSKLRDSHLGDDAAQEAFVRIWQGLKTYSTGTFVSWCFKISDRVCIDILRKRSKEPTPAESLPGDRMDNKAELRREVLIAIDALREPYRTTLLMREAGLSYKELSDALECPVGTVRSRLNEARSLLAKQLAHLITGGDQ